MNNYVIFADSACDISPSVLSEWGVKYTSLTFRFEDSDTEYSNEDMPPKEFYEKMRDGKVARTSAVNIETLKIAFEQELKNGNDVIYISFSSGLSTTYNSGRIAAEELSEEYPERKVIAVDSLSASAGYGLLLYLAVEEKKKGASIEEINQFVIDTRLNICHWFTVDDLKYLKRGGRISPTAALVGNMLGIKPILHMDNEGKLVNVSKSRGRKTALKAIADKYSELAVNPSQGPVFACQADCMEDIKELEAIIKERHGVSFDYIADIGPVIGAHAGPGTLSVFFIGKER